ncbi:C4-dicarboxylate TRAP transporter large permease protein DctM [Tepidimonas sediminis]|uniref:C4-dicarboxylate TRAP transporter large permease protein DctM n=1 Tax=Tepidimonas sediminis TaxID=2588941 RepID=A0A554WGL5_9BURK|nr:TRAP transporter permease [Tepidimonas sediminis]TSE22689.1 C4-dicarboxylate TRAP transporter large permease protein DctM [Tepidimonas sediminis]
MSAVHRAAAPAAAAPRVDLRTPVVWVALAFAAFQLWMAAFHTLSSQVIRALHVGFVLWLIFLLYPPLKGRGGTLGAAGAALGWALGLAGFATGLYQWVFEADLTQRAGELERWDWVAGIAAIALVFEAARRVMGWGLPVICALFLAYAAFGQHLPGALAHRGYDWEVLIATLGFGTEGIYGTPTYVSSTYIFLFILFGAFLEQAGMVRLFTDFAMGTVGHTRGGPAKVAVISSGLMGTINGSGVANVVTTGQFTIPLMKRFGYRPAFAGGVEATSSMGGQIMPPVMGAVAFIMAETINVPYVAIVKAALIPAVLYFVTVFWMVHLEAGRCGLHGLPRHECPNPWTAVRERWYLLLPLVGLVALLFSGYTPMFSGTVGLALTVILIFAAAVMQGIRGTALRVLFWVLLALACGGFFRFGAGAFLVVTAALVVLTYVLRCGREARAQALRALVDGAQHALPVAAACALVGVLIGVINLTGVAAEIGGHVIGIGRANLLLALVLTMVTCLVLGMGIPTIPNYIITSSLAAPVLLELGVPLIVSHMFVFYFGIMADLTPPVALAAFAAAPIARERGLLISLNAVRVAIAGFVVPYMAVYSPALMLQGEAGPLAVAWVVFKALVAIGLWGAAAIGFLWGPLRAWERLWAFAAAALLVAALPVTDELGLGAAALWLAWHGWQRRRRAAAAA